MLATYGRDRDAPAPVAGLAQVQHRPRAGRGGRRWVIKMVEAMRHGCLPAHPARRRAHPAGRLVRWRRAAAHRVPAVAATGRPAPGGRVVVRPVRHQRTRDHRGLRSYRSRSGGRHRRAPDAGRAFLLPGCCRPTAERTAGAAGGAHDLVAAATRAGGRRPRRRARDDPHTSNTAPGHGTTGTAARRPGRPRAGAPPPGGCPVAAGPPASRSCSADRDPNASAWVATWPRRSPRSPTPRPRRWPRGRLMDRPLATCLGPRRARPAPRDPLHPAGPVRLRGRAGPAAASWGVAPSPGRTLHRRTVRRPRRRRALPGRRRQAGHRAGPAMQALPAGGAMIAVQATEAEVTEVARRSRQHR